MRALLTSLSMLLLGSALACTPADPLAQRSFESPEEALAAMAEALENDDVEALLAILGPAYESRIVTPDWAAEREGRQRIVEAAREQSELVEIADGEVELVIGASRWPFPVPVVRGEDGRWRFDTEEGLEVVVDRRIGRNELSVIQLLDAYVDAQIEYASSDRDGDEVREYAQRLGSTPGQRDGLYWEVEEGEEPSPFGPLVEGAEAYLETLQPGDPIRGYFFRVLTRQGESAPGGAYDYVINGNMIAGFGLVAFPAEHGNTGIMTFVVSHQGRIHQKDLGGATDLDTYDPDDSWTRVTLEDEG